MGYLIHHLSMAYTYINNEYNGGKVDVQPKAEVSLQHFKTMVRT